MKSPAYKIGVSYLSFSILYFLTAYFLSRRTMYTADNAFEGFFNSINNMFFWAQAYVYFVLVIIGSAGVGTLYTQLKGYRKSCMIFRTLLLVSILALGILLLISNF